MRKPHCGFHVLAILLFQNENIARGIPPLGQSRDGYGWRNPEPLPGVHILIEENKEGTATGEDGRF